MKNILFLLAIVAILFQSCNSDTPATEQAGVTDSTATAAAAVEPGSVKIICQALPSNDDTPRHEIFLKMGESKVKIADINACETITPDLYSSYTIPAEAIDAAGGWWAGQGDYVYVIQEGGKYVVKQGYMSEEQGDEGYHFKTVLTFTKEGKQVL